MVEKQFAERVYNFISLRFALSILLFLLNTEFQDNHAIGYRKVSIDQLVFKTCLPRRFNSSFLLHIILATQLAALIFFVVRWQLNAVIIHFNFFAAEEDFFNFLGMIDDLLGEQVVKEEVTTEALALFGSSMLIHKHKVIANQRAVLQVLGHGNSLEQFVQVPFESRKLKNNDSCLLCINLCQPVDGVSRVAEVEALVSFYWRVGDCDVVETGIMEVNATDTPVRDDKVVSSLSLS